MKVPRDQEYHDHGSRWRFTTRAGFEGAEGISRPPYEQFNLGLNVGDDPLAVQVNRSVLTREIGAEPQLLAFMSQVHGTNIAEINGPTPEPVPYTDGMVSATPGVGLAVLVADCVPVMAQDPERGVIGVAHAGRLGAAAGIVPALVDRMVSLGAHAPDLQVVLGPAICGRCYEVPAAMRDAVEAQLPGSACETAQGTAGLDLRIGLARQLRALGVGAVEIDERCTREDPDLFSHRRSSPTGRFAGVIRL
ncbi:YfiH family protein [Nakamurella sp. UYEF19]|uniref:peptidoglycan editing factor PgeF n=1 Tax=Nakamurella sp. UYEF19 TaxID=1756392 RepID=UPI003391D035